MRKLGLVLVAAALATASCATAGNVADGRVARIDWSGGNITLDTGETFVVPARRQLNRLTTGDRVAVSYVVEGDQRIATQIWGPRPFP